MSTLVAIAYDDLDKAKEVMGTVGGLVKEHSLTLEDAVIVEHRANGKMKLHQPSLTGLGAASGALWGGLIGLIFLGFMVVGFIYFSLTAQSRADDRLPRLIPPRTDTGSPTWPSHRPPAAGRSAGRPVRRRGGGGTGGRRVRWG